MIRESTDDKMPLHMREKQKQDADDFMRSLADADKRKSWMVNGCFLDFAEPVTLGEAQDMERDLRLKMWGDK